MEYSTNSILPDSLTGAILGLEGIRDAAVVLNSPTGCKLYHAAVADGQFPREVCLDALNYMEEFYFGQPRVPCTYLDSHDYIYGSAMKLEKLLPLVARRGYSLIVVVNSPGAALIGDELNQYISKTSLPIPCIALENTGFSGKITDGFQQAVMVAISSLSSSPCPVVEKSVNLLGVSIYHKHWEGNIAELSRLLSLCGIKVISTVCAGASVEELSQVSAAACNVIVHEEYSEILAPWLERTFGTPSVKLAAGAPVGFKATERWIEMVAEAVGADPAPARQAIEAARQRCFLILERFNSLTGLPKGATFAIYADPSLAYAVSNWLYAYLGMIPVAVEVAPAGGRVLTERLTGFLEKIGCGSAWQASLERTAPDLILADGNTIARLKGKGIPAAGIEIALPSLGYMDVVPKALLGIQGTFCLIEQVINGLYTGGIP